MPVLEIRRRALRGGVPLVVRRSADLGLDVKAVVLVARHEGEKGDDGRSFKYWRRAAKMAHMTAALLVGEGLYLGTFGGAQVGRDAETAVIFLTRGVRLATAPGTVLAFSERARLGRACLLLGFLTLDGEGCREDTEAAIQWFRQAVKNGNADAARQLATLYSTGAYGRTEYL